MNEDVSSRRKKVIFQQIILFFWPVPISTDETKPPKEFLGRGVKYVLFMFNPEYLGKYSYF